MRDFYGELVDQEAASVGAGNQSVDDGEEADDGFLVKASF
jgi:hypothetical protein